MKYSDGKIYKLQCDTGHFYYGSTTISLCERFGQHKYNLGRHPEQRVYKHIASIGWDHVRIVLVDTFACENKEQLVRKEDEYIKLSLGNELCLNYARAIADPEHTKEIKKKYYENNKEQIKETHRRYRENNKTKVTLEGDIS
jgi:PIN domain nuclease of toxin-antitoxin system